MVASKLSLPLSNNHKQTKNNVMVVEIAKHEIENNTSIKCVGVYASLPKQLVTLVSNAKFYGLERAASETCLSQKMVAIAKRYI